MLSSVKKVADKAMKFVSSNILAIVGVVVLVYMLYMYGGLKNVVSDSMTSGSGEGVVPKVTAPTASMPDNEYQTVQGVTTSTHGLPPSCMKQSTMDPKELLPKDANSEWASLNPNGSGELSDVNLLKAGHHIGINTVGQSLRNANLQLRSEPPNPQVNVGPWHQTTIEPDMMRVPLELGVGSQ